MARRMTRRPRRRTLTFLMLVGLLALIPLVVVTSASANHLFVIQNDQQSADDQPGQKDLSLHGLDSSHGSGVYWVMWQWDVTNLSGNNTGDACALFDSDNPQNFRVDFALCVTIGKGATGSVQLSTSPRLYTCGDAKVDRCTSPVTQQALPSGWACTVNTNANDPFHAGEKDTQAICNFDVDDIGGSTVKLVNTCSYPSQAPNSDPSDCVLLPRDAFLTIVKTVSPAGSTSSGSFTFKLDDTATGCAPSGAFTCSQLAISSTGTHQVSEDLPSDFDFTSSSCAGAGDSNGTSGNPITIDARPDDTVTCTFTNTRKLGTLVVTKVVTNDNGGNKGCADFSFKVDNGSATAFESDCSNSVSVQGGSSHTVTEAAVTGYATSYSNCTNVTVPAGGSATCTVTNNDQPATLTVVKDLTNDNGGTASCGNFKFTVNAGSETAFEGDCSNELTVNAGTYSVAETAATGYTTTYTNCSSVVIANGGSATCTIHNNDQAGTLIVTKVVDNANGVGSKACGDFSFQVDVGSATPFEGDCSNSVSVAAGTYDVTEPAVDGYTTGYNNCDNVTVANGGSATCTITNTVKVFKLIVLVCKGNTLYRSNVTLPSGQNLTKSLPSGTANEATLCSLGGATYQRGIGTYSPQVVIANSEAGP